MWPFTVNCESCGESIWRTSKRCPYCGQPRGKGRVAPGVLAPPRPVPAELRCPACKRPLDAAQNFCPMCGAGAASGTRRCADGGCGAFSPGDARYCVACGRPFAESVKPALRGETVWARTGDDLMARIEVRDVEGVFKKGLVVEFGTEALFLVDGKFIGPLEPGRHDLGGLLKRGIDLRLRYEATAVVYDNSQFSLRFEGVKTLTRESAEVLVDCELRLRIEDAAAVFTTLAKGADRYPRSALQEFLAGEVANGLADAVRPHGVQEFRESFALKHDFDLALARHMRATLENCGLALSQLRILNYRQERLDEQSRRIAEYFFESCDISIEAGGRKQKLDARVGLMGVERQELAADAENLRLTLAPRAAFLEATRNLQAADLENENVLAELRQKYDMAQVSRDVAFEQFIAQAQANREQAVRMLQERLDQDYRQLTVLNATEMARLVGEQRVVEVEQEQRKIRKGFDADLERQRISFDFEMEKAGRSQDLLARTLQVQREAELASARGHMEIGLAQARGMAELKLILKDLPPEQILAIESPADFARVLEARAGRELVQQFLGAQLQQQKDFIQVVREQASAAMQAQAQVASRAAERPAAVVFGGPMSTAATIAPGTGASAPAHLSWCPACNLPAPLPPDARCPKCGAALVSKT